MRTTSPSPRARVAEWRPASLPATPTASAIRASHQGAGGRAVAARASKYPGRPTGRGGARLGRRLARTDHGAGPGRITSRRRGNSAAPMASPSPRATLCAHPRKSTTAPRRQRPPEWEWHPRPAPTDPLPPLQPTHGAARPGRWERVPCWLSLARSVVVAVRATNSRGLRPRPGRRCSPMLDLPCSGAGAGSIGSGGQRSIGRLFFRA
jgi:hypothetical protein